MARLKIVITTVVMGVVLGGAGSLFVGRADGATPLSLADYEKLPPYLRAEQAKENAKEAKGMMARRNQAEEARAIQTEKTKARLEGRLQETAQNRFKNSDRLQQEELRGRFLLAEAGETALNQNNPATIIEPNGKTRYLDIMNPELLMKEHPNYQEEEINTERENTSPGKKRRPANAWRIVLASAEIVTPPVQGGVLFPAVEYQDERLMERKADSERGTENLDRQFRHLEERFKTEQNLIRMASAGAGFKPAPAQVDLSRSTRESAFDWQEGIGSELDPLPLPIENRGSLVLAVYHPEENNKRNEEESDGHPFQPLGSHPSRVFEL